MKRIAAFLGVMLAVQISQALPGIVFSTYLGGNASDDDGFAIAVDQEGCTYVAGSTSSTNFIRTIEIPPGTVNGGYVIKLGRDGALRYAAMIYGVLDANSMAVDSNGCVYVTGGTTASNFPVTANAFQPGPSSVSREAFLLKLNATGHLEFATYLGGAGTDDGEAVAVDEQGYAYVTGWTASTNFPVTSNAYQSVRTSFSENFVTRFTPDGTGIVYSTYAGSGQPSGIAIDTSGCAVITGRTGGGIPVVHAIQPGYGGGTYDAYILRLSETGSEVLYGTYFGGSSTDESNDIELDEAGNMYIAGATDSLNLMITNAFQPTNALGQDAFFAKLTPAGTNLVFSSYLGRNQPDQAHGIAVDAEDRLYVAGWTTCNDFPIQHAVQPLKGSNDFISTFKPDMFVMQFEPDGSNLIYSTFWGGGKTEYAYDMSVSRDGAVSLVGITESVTSFPVRLAVQDAFAGGEQDAAVVRFPPIDIDDPEMSDSTSISNGAIAIQWFAEAGWQYDVEYAETFQQPVSWVSLPGFTNLPGFGETIEAIEDVSSISQRTYRVFAH